jgi:hypothetical protein
MSTSPLPPDLQLALETLFELFSAYVSAGDVHERSQIHSQILDLFSRLGVAAESPLVRQAADLFDRIKQDTHAPEPREATLPNLARRIVAMRLREFERSPNAIRLTTGARQLLRTPVVEAVEFTGELDPAEVNNSLDVVLKTLMEPPVSNAEGTIRVRTSVAVIRGFWKNFCRIPPFCAGRETR